MRFVLAPDSFKESMSARECAAAMARGIRRVFYDADIASFPISDGGEGFCEAVATPLDAEVRELTVRGALGEPILAKFAYIARDKTAVVEVAQAVGLAAIPPERRDIFHASSYGVGQCIVAALDAGAQKIIVGLGGSSTNDGGAGMLQALGWRFYDSAGQELGGTPAALANLATIDSTKADPRLAKIVFEDASDVTNPLCGAHGASAIFGPQKGATQENIAELDDILASFAEISENTAGVDPEIKNAKGAGAAGGLGYAFLGFLHATMHPGIDVVAKLTGLENAISKATIVFTGEGKIDAQTADGKAPWGIAQIAARYRVPVIAFGGTVAPEADILCDEGFSALIAISEEDEELAAALVDGPKNMEKAAEFFCRRLLPEYVHS